MKTLFFAVATLAVVACQQNTKKEAPSQGENTPLTTQEETTPLPETDWKKEGLKDQVKTRTTITYEAIEKNGQFAQGEIIDIVRSHFNPQGFITLTEVFETFNDFKNNTPIYSESFLYDDQGRLLETNGYNSNEGKVATYTYRYNEQGDIVYTKDINVTSVEPTETRYQYTYTPEGKQRTLVNNGETISFYNKKNQLIWEKFYEKETGDTTLTEYTYNDKGLLIKEVTFINGKQEDIMESTYDPYGNRTSFYMKGSIGNLSETSQYTYDDQGNVLEDKTISLSNGETRSSDHSYTYDNHGNIISARHMNPEEPVFLSFLIEYY